MDSHGPKSSSLQRQVIASKIKELIDKRRNSSHLYIFSAMHQIYCRQMYHEAAMHSNLALKDPELLKSFAKRAFPLYSHRTELLQTVPAKVYKLCDDLERYRQEGDPKAVDEALKSYVKYRMSLAKKENKKLEIIIDDLLSKMREQDPGNAVAKKYFFFLKKEHYASIDAILDLVEANLNDDVKNKIYRIQKCLENEGTAGTTPLLRKEQENATGSEELHLQGEAGCDEEMELDPQLSEAKSNEIGAEKLVRDKAIKRRRSESTIMCEEQDLHNTATRRDP